MVSCSGGETKNSHSKEKWEFMDKEQGVGQRMENY